MMYQIFSDPPKSPFSRRTLKNLAPLFKGGWGDQSVSLMTIKNLSNNLLLCCASLKENHIKHIHQYSLSPLKIGHIQELKFMIPTLIIAWILFVILLKVLKTTVKNALTIAAILILLNIGFGITPEDIWQQIRQITQTISPQQ